MTGDDIAQWFPHGYCLAWDWRVILLNVFGNVLTFMSYVTLSILVIRAWHLDQLPSIMTTASAPMWAAFIWSCGFTHMMHVFTTYQPAYWLETTALLLTGTISATTAIMTIVRVRHYKRGISP